MAGYLTNGLPTYTAAEMSGVETLPMDTQKASGREPQSVGVTAAVLKDFVFGGKAAANATATAGAATASGGRGKITTEALTTAAAALYTLTLTNDQIAAGDIVVAKLGDGTNAQGAPVITNVVEGAGSVVIEVKNVHASEALNGTLVISYVVFKA